MFQTKIIMKQEHIIFLLKKKEFYWVLFGIILFQLMDQLRPKTGNPLVIFLLISVFVNIMSS